MVQSDLFTDDAHIDLMRWDTAAVFPSLQVTSIVEQL